MAKKYNKDYWVETFYFYNYRKYGRNYPHQYIRLSFKMAMLMDWETNIELEVEILGRALLFKRKVPIMFKKREKRYNYDPLTAKFYLYRYKKKSRRYFHQYIRLATPTVLAVAWKDKQRLGAFIEGDILMLSPLEEMET